MIRYAIVAGVAIAEQRPHTKIIGGQIAPLEEFAFVVSILACDDPLDVNTCSHTCSGSLISPNVVLTAAHCVRNSEARFGDYLPNIAPENLRVVVGSVNWKDIAETGRLLDVQSIVFGSYAMNIRFTWDGDIALLQLLECVDEVAGEIEYARVATWESEPDRSSGCTEVTAAGFGKISNVPVALYQDDYSMRYIVDTLHSEDICRESYAVLEQQTESVDLENSEEPSNFSILEDNYICSGGASFQSVCSGDSGGPVFVRMDDGRAQVIGLTSFGFGGDYCTIGPDFATRVAFYADWINTQLSETFAVCQDWDIATSFASNPLNPYPEESLSSAWTSSRCNPSADLSSPNWQCLNGECISSDQVCDGPANCSDGSDESGSLCPNGGRRLSEVVNKEEAELTCSEAVDALNAAIDSVQANQVTIGDTEWDPSGVRAACEPVQVCTEEEASEAISFCLQLEEWINNTELSNQFGESFASKFDLTCSLDKNADSHHSILFGLAMLVAIMTLV